MRPEGWYLDPYGVHEHRWFSDGYPTSLVRDGSTETEDPPPAEAPWAPMIEVRRPERSAPPVATYGALFAPRGFVGFRPTRQQFWLGVVAYVFVFPGTGALLGLLIAVLSHANLGSGAGIGSALGAVLGLWVWSTRVDWKQQRDLRNTDWSGDYYPR